MGETVTARICVIGADAMEPALIRAWAESGELPNLARLRERAVWGPLVGPPRFFSGASWPSFFTGVSAPRHGMYLQTVYDPATCDHHPFRPKAPRLPPFWSRPQWQTKRKTILNIPYCPLDPELRGVQVVDWGVHDRHYAQATTVPPPLAEHILARFGRDPVGDCAAVERTVAGFSKLQENLLQRLEQKRRMIAQHLDDTDWELFVAVLDECHCAGHQLWHFHDRAHGRHDPNAPAALRRSIRDVYLGIDRILGDALDRLGDDTTILFVSSHGMGQAFDANGAFEEILRRLDGQPPRSPDYPDQRGRTLAKVRRVMDRMPAPLRRALDPIRRRYGRGRLIARLQDERRQRRCFWFPTHDLWGGIRINLVGREASGIVHPGRECEEYIGRLTQDLLELRDGRSGEPIVREVTRPTEMQRAGHDGEQPDLIVRWAKTSLSWIESPKVGVLETAPVAERSGDHDPAMYGVFFAAGPGIAAGQLDEPVRIEDFAVTISQLAGLTLPDTDGSVIAPIVGGGQGR